MKIKDMGVLPEEKKNIPEREYCISNNSSQHSSSPQS